MTHAAVAVEELELDLPALASAFGRRLHAAGVPVTPERSARFAQALALTRPVARRRLYWTARAVLVSDAAQVKAFDAVFHEVFGSRVFMADEDVPELGTEAAPPDDRAPGRGRPGAAGAPGGGALRRRARAELARGASSPSSPATRSVLRGKRFDALEPGELAQPLRADDRS